MTERKESEMDNGDIRARVVALEQQGNSRDQRISNLESWRQHQEISGARQEEKWLHLDKRFNSIDDKIDEVSSSMQWINRLILGGIAMGVLSFILQGGLKLPG